MVNQVPYILSFTYAPQPVNGRRRQIEWGFSQDALSASTIRPIRSRNVPSPDSTGWRPCVVSLARVLSASVAAIDQNLALLRLRTLAC
jgi:hypothetical protein